MRLTRLGFQGMRCHPLTCGTMFVLSIIMLFYSLDKMSATYREIDVALRSKIAELSPIQSHNEVLQMLKSLNIRTLILNRGILEKIKDGRPVLGEDIAGLSIVIVLAKNAQIVGNLLNKEPNRNISTISSQLPRDVTIDRGSRVMCYRVRGNDRAFTIIMAYVAKNFVYIPSCLPAERHDLFTSAVLGQTPMVFDRFKLRKLEIDGYKLIVPNDVTHALIQYPFSHYYECRWDIASDYSDENEVPEMVEIYMNASLTIKDKLRSLGKLPIAMCGTLLGWYRQCNIIRNTGDMDFGLYSHDLDKKLHEVLQKHPNITGRTHNMPDDGFQYFLYVYGGRVDLFFLYDLLGPEKVYLGAWAPPRYRIRMYYPRFEVCSAVLLGHRFNIPCRIETLLQLEYGKWMQRADAQEGDLGDLRWPHNGETLESWNDEDFKRAYMELDDPENIV